MSDEAEALLRDAATREEPTYLRLSDAANTHPRSTDRGLLQIERREPSATSTVITVGPMLDRVREALADRRVNLLYASTVHPLDKRTLREVATGTDIVLVEPYLAGTSTAAVAEALADRPHRILALGVGRRALRRYGVAAEHDAAHGLDVAGLRSSIDGFLRSNPQTVRGPGVTAGNLLGPPAYSVTECRPEAPSAGWPHCHATRNVEAARTCEGSRDPWPCVGSVPRREIHCRGES